MWNALGILPLNMSYPFVTASNSVRYRSLAGHKPVPGHNTNSFSITALNGRDRYMSKVLYCLCHVLAWQEWHRGQMQMIPITATHRGARVISTTWQGCDCTAVQGSFPSCHFQHHPVQVVSTFCASSQKHTHGLFYKTFRTKWVRRNSPADDRGYFSYEAL